VNQQTQIALVTSQLSHAAQHAAQQTGNR